MPCGTRESREAVLSDQLRQVLYLLKVVIGLTGYYSDSH